MTLLSRACVSPYYLYISISLKLCLYLIQFLRYVKKWRDLENWVRGCSRSFKTAPFDRPQTTFYWSAIVNISLACTVFLVI